MPDLRVLLVADAEQLGHLLLLPARHRRPHRPEAAGPRGEHEAPDRRHAPNPRSRDGSRAAAPRCDPPGRRRAGPGPRAGGRGGGPTTRSRRRAARRACRPRRSRSCAAGRSRRPRGTARRSRDLRAGSSTGIHCQAWRFEPDGAWRAISMHSSMSVPSHRALEIEPLAHGAGGREQLVGRQGQQFGHGRASGSSGARDAVVAHHDRCQVSRRARSAVGGVAAGEVAEDHGRADACRPGPP